MTAYSYAWRRSRPADLAAGYYECARCYIPDRPMGPRHSMLERAHLDGDSRNDDPSNILLLCRTCHRRHDKEDWLADRRVYLERVRAEKVEALDAGRPILVMLEAYGKTA